MLKYIPKEPRLLPCSVSWLSFLSNALLQASKFQMRQRNQNLDLHLLHPGMAQAVQHITKSADNHSINTIKKLLIQ